MAYKSSVKERLLVVDADEQVRGLLRRILEREGYRPTEAADAAQAHERLASATYHLILTDVRLPHGSGLDLIEEGLARYSHLGALVISAVDDLSLADQALRLGAYGYVVKPFTANEVLIGVLGALRSTRAAIEGRTELQACRDATRRLAIAIEAHDPVAAPHIHEMSDLCGRIARQLELPSEEAEVVRAASQLHDVGNAALSDALLRKSGRFSAEERKQMQRHTELGYRTLAGSRTQLLQTAASIAWTHHERFDGSGYPRGLSGDEIPLEGRIAAVADVFDSLARDRPHRRRFSREETLTIVEEGRGTEFDPTVVDALLRILESGEQRAPGPGGLTPRELEVLQLAADGSSASEIAEALKLSRGTVKTHFQHIYEKLGVRSRASAVALGMRSGLIE